MPELFSDWPFIRIGWTAVQFIWIGALLIGTVAAVLRLMNRISSKSRYRIAYGSLFILALIPILLWVEHHPVVPPFGLAEWNAERSVASMSTEPLIQGLPKLTGINLGSNADAIYRVIGIGWTVLGALLALFFLVSAILVWIRCRRLPDLNDHVVLKQIDKLSCQLKGSRPYRIKTLSAGSSPAVAGIVRPCLMVPRHMRSNYTRAEIEALLTHELLHIKRRDYAASLLQHMLAALLCVQPLLLWLTRYIDREREFACDESASAITRDKRRYAQTLMKLQKSVFSPASSTLHFARNPLLPRIQRLVNPREAPRAPIWRQPRVWTAGLLMVIALFTFIWSSYHLHFVA